MRVLFVCTGNTCRSPMAEAILKSKQLPGVEVKSAGVYAMDGQEASHHAQSVLAENNIPKQHLSSLLTETHIEWATYILSMTEGHKSAIIRQYPVAAPKTFTLKEFAGLTETGAGSDILDPFGGPIEIYRETFKEINEAILQMIERLSSETETRTEPN